MDLLTLSWTACYGITIISSAFLAAFLYMTRNFDYWKKRGILEEKPIPFFGSFFPCISFQKCANQFFRDLYDKHKSESLVGFYIFDKPCLLVRDIDLANRIMVKDFTSFKNKYASAGEHDPLGSANLFMLKFPHWQTVRRKLSPIFTSGRLKNMFHLLANVGQDLDRYFESFNFEGEGRVMELNETCANYTTDLIATCAYGIQANCLNNPNAEFRKYGRKVFDFNYKRSFELGSIFFAPGIVSPLGLMFFEKSSSDFLRTALWDTLTQRMENRIHRNDLIDTLIKLKENQPQAEIDDPNSFKFDGDNLTAQAAIFFTAGFQTTSVTLSFTLYELAVNLDIQSRLRKEIISAVDENGGNLSYEWTTQLPYLDMVVSETLRKYSIVGFIDRVAVTDYKVPESNLVIEKGTPVFIPVIGFHNDPEYFPQPDKYDPERFDVENKQKLASSAYMPFGKGPRTCIGLRFALASVKLGLAKIIMSYKLTPCKDTVIPARINPKAILTEMDHPLLLNMQKITSVACN